MESKPIIRSFEDLECWKACRELRLFVSKTVVPHLPKEEQFRPKDQILRSSRSTTANLAEGYGRYHHLDNAKFVSNARGSLYETLDHLSAAYDESFISEETLKAGRVLVIQAARITNGYMEYLKRTTLGPPPKPSTKNNTPNNQ